MPPIRAADRPALSTVPNIEILEVGTWATSTGVFAIDQDDLACAVAAYDDPGYTTPVVKLGHVDPRFDGEPALGRIINPRLTGDGMTLVVDLAGVPTWLADIMASAFPRRSIEGEFGHTTQTGSKHKFALTALSLLGVQAPAISTLADIALLYGLDPVAVAASAASSLAADLPEEPVPVPEPETPVRVAASVNLDKVRQSFYADDDTARQLRGEVGGWPWVREVYNDFVVVDDDEGSLYRIPWSEDSAKPGEVSWGEPSKVRVEYVAASADAPDSVLRRGALRCRIAAMGTADPMPATPPQVEQPDATVLDTPQPDPEPEVPEQPAPHVPAEPENETTTSTEDPVSDLSDIARTLGLPDDAGKDAILAALAARQPADEPDNPTPQPEPTPAPVPQPEPERQPELVAAALPAEAAAELKRLSAELASIKAREAAGIKASLFDSAVRAGKLAPAERPAWEARYDKAPDLVAEIIAAKADGEAVPVSPHGYTGTGEETTESFDDSEYERLFGEKAGA
jgi:hypothetical protein